jgi:hypothetical protein
VARLVDIVINADFGRGNSACGKKYPVQKPAE